jgi:hypothetical protein
MNVADQEDARFFLQHPDRQAHIRMPKPQVVINAQRGAAYASEMEAEFRQLGAHKKDRRRILLWRIPEDNPHYDPAKRGILKIPFLAFSDETIEDRDDILLPLLHEIMGTAR